MEAINILSSKKVPWLKHKAHSDGQSDTLLVQYCWLDSQSKFVKNQHLKKCCSFFPFFSVNTHTHKTGQQIIKVVAHKDTCHCSTCGIAQRAIVTVVCQSETGRELFTKLFKVGFSQALLPLNERLSAQNFNTLISTTFHKVNDFHKSQNVNDFWKNSQSKKFFQATGNHQH